MLENPKLNEDQSAGGLRVLSGSSSSGSGSRQKELSVREAYRHLGIVTSQTDVTLRLQVSKDRELVSGPKIKEGLKEDALPRILKSILNYVT